PQRGFHGPPSRPRQGGGSGLGASDHDRQGSARLGSGSGRDDAFADVQKALISRKLAGMTSPAAASLWKASPEAQLLWRQWDGEYVVYNPASGDTHLLNPVAAAALQCLEQSPTSLAQLTEWVASELDLESEPELRQHLEKLLTQFEELGLIEVVIE